MLYYSSLFSSFRLWIQIGTFVSPQHTLCCTVSSGRFSFPYHDIRHLLDFALPIERARLSPISDEPLRGLRGEWAARWPGLADVPWFPAVGDGACSNVGCGCATRDRLALMVGTSGALRMAWKADSVDIPDGPWCYRVDADRFVMGGALSDGGNLVGWLRKTLRLPEPD